MARRQPVTPLRLAFLVEGNQDKDFVEGLVPRLVGPSVQLRVVRVGGKAAFSSTYYEAARFMEAGYASVFLLMDADTAIPAEIEVQRENLAEVFRRYGLEKHVQIHIAVPMLESWLLAAYTEQPEQSTRPKQDLARFAGPDALQRIRSLAAELPLEVARSRSKSFDHFVKGLEAIVPVKARRAS